MSTTVIRQLTEDITIFSKPFLRSGLIPFGGRSTAIRMKDGGVWVLASTPLDGETRATIDSMGPVKYIVGADSVHHLFLGQFQKAYPEAKLIAVQEAIDKKTAEGLRFDGAWGKDEPGTKYGFEPEIQHIYFTGHSNKDVAFYHADSKTLIEADLLFNLPATEQYSQAKSWLPIFGFGLQPDSAIQKFAVTNGMAKDVEAMKRDAKAVAAWDFDRIIPCHGDVIEKFGKKAWEQVYANFLK
jgi:glyoxylase-like metal-dependent hydrolase (beta-lactamase superfamily II)